MRTVLEQLNDDVQALKELVNQFLLLHSGIEYAPVKRVPGLLMFTSDYHWRALNLEGKQFQTRLFNEYNRFAELVSVLLTGLPNDPIDIFNEKAKLIIEYIQQNSFVCDSSVEEVINQVNNSLDEQLNLLSAIYDSKSGSYIFVPDTNALLTNPNFEKWEFDGVPNFEILLIPVVSSELDKHKMFHSNPDVRDKAKNIINRLKEYRRRGRLTEGVAIVKNRITLRALAIEPKFEKTLSWLDITSNDDRILASFIEIMKLHINSSVVFVTADINLQNKAEFARIPFTEPPEAEI